MSMLDHRRLLLKLDTQPCSHLLVEFCMQLESLGIASTSMLDHRRLLLKLDTQPCSHLLVEFCMQLYHTERYFEYCLLVVD